MMERKGAWMCGLALAVLWTVACALDYPATDGAQEDLEPDGTYLYVQRDSCDLYLDVYEPQGSGLAAEGGKPTTLLCVNGDGFTGGKRDDPRLLAWRKALVEAGYRIISIDCRAGLEKGQKIGLRHVNLLDEAIHLTVEDLFSATEFILDNREMMGVDPERIVIAGAYSGGVTVLQADYELCNRSVWAEALPAGFHYAGVMAFSGGILSRKGKVKYEEEPAPTFLLDGEDGQLSAFRKIQFFNVGFFGPEKIAGRFSRFGHDCHLVRQEREGQMEIGDIMGCVPSQLSFLEKEITSRAGKITDQP